MRRPSAALQKRAASSTSELRQSMTKVLSRLRCMTPSSRYPCRVVMLGSLVVAREQPIRIGIDDGRQATLSGELLDGAPRIPCGDGDELDLVARGAAQEPRPTVTADAVDARQDPVAQHPVVLVRIR